MRKSCAVFCLLAITIFNFKAEAQNITASSKLSSIYNKTYLFAGFGLAKQQVHSGNYISPFNYDLSDYDKNMFKPGYLLGARFESRFQDKFDYALSFSLNKLASGAVYKDPASIQPFIGKFTHFKADDQMLNANISALYKKHLAIGDRTKFNWYVVGGPSLDIRLSNQTEDNIALNAYKPIILSGKIGAEFNNRSYYTLFFHYKQSLHSITNSPINTSINGFELGMMVKASDIF